MIRSFDYVVVGSGSSGAVVASRLSEDPDLSVLVVEAGGPDRHPLQTMPIAFLKVAYSSRYDWAFESEPEPGLGNRRLPIPRGKTLGGTSSVNALIAIRGHPRDYDLWRQQGLEGWSYADVLPYFRRLENHWLGDTEHHGAGGPVSITPMTGRELLYDPLVSAARAAGIPLSADPNGGELEGISRMEATIGGGSRSSTARAYLRPAMRRRNLHVETDALAIRVLVERGRAIGLEYAQGGNLVQVRAEREVVLSAGSYGSPQLLMLSGIGPAADLAGLGIPVVHELPGVGANLSEHPNLTIEFRVRDRIGLTRCLRFDRAARHALRWWLRRDGPFAENGATANLFLRTRPGLERPDVQIVCMSVSNLAGLWFPGLTAPPVYSFAARVGALHPQSRGWIKLRSANPRDKPRILFNMFAVDDDLSTMLRGIRIAREIYRQKPLADLIEHETFLGAELTDDATIANLIRANAGHRSHPVGTCRMGTGPDAVVDAQLRVYGIEALRIADASVMPDLPSGNTNLPCIMIGEKAADLIRSVRSYQNL